MCNTHKGGVRFRLAETLATLETLTERRDALRAEFQKSCKHEIVLELEDLGVRNAFSARVCKECGLEEQVWVDERGMSSDYKVLAGKEGRMVTVGASIELLHYKSLAHLLPQK